MANNLDAHDCLTGCPRCDQHGPDLPPMRLAWGIEDRRDFHRAWHDLSRVFTNLLRAGDPSQRIDPTVVR